MKNTLLKAIKEAGKIASEGFSKEKKFEYKGSIDLVTEYDLACEKKIIEIIKKKFPEHDILTEETKQKDLHSEYKWIIDPIDGTTNFFHGHPFYCVSIGVEYKKEIIMGAVYAPYLNELFFAEKNKGAYLNNKLIKVSQIKTLKASLLSTGFPYDIATSKDNNINYFLAFVKEVQAIRRDGAAALDLCYVACGRFDGFWELKLHPWDMAAGSLIVKEAGGRISNFNTEELDIYTRDVIAANVFIYDEMKKIIMARG